MLSRRVSSCLPVLCALALLAAGCARSQPEGRVAAVAAAEAPVQPAAPPPTADAAAATADAEPVIHVYKTPTCGCCADWVEHVEQAGFRTEVQDLPDVRGVKQRLGVPENLGSCHTALVGDYVVEGHVPAEVIRRLLSERPDIAGIAVPGMPIGSPGMEMGSRRDPYQVIAFRRSGERFVFENR